MWRTVQLVGSGFTLAAFVAAAITSLLQSRLRKDEKLIRTALPRDRARLVAKSLEFFDVDAERLTQQQRFQIAVEQIRSRARRFAISSAVILALSLIAAAVTVFALYKSHNETPNMTPGGASPTAQPHQSAPADVVVRKDGSPTMNQNAIDHKPWPTEPRILCITTGDAGYGKLHEQGLRAAVERTGITVVSIYEYLGKSSDNSPYDLVDLNRIKASLMKEINSGQVIGIVGPCLDTISAEILRYVSKEIPEIPIILESPVTRAELGFTAGMPYGSLNPPYPVFRISSGIDERNVHLSRLISFLIQQDASVGILLEDTSYAQQLLVGVETFLFARPDLPRTKLQKKRLARKDDLEDAKAIFASSDVIFYFGTGGRYVEIANGRLYDNSHVFLVGLMNAWAFGQLERGPAILPRVVDLEDIPPLGAAAPRNDAQRAFESRFGPIGPSVRDQAFSYDAGLCLIRGWQDTLARTEEQKRSYGICLRSIRNYLERRDGHECVSGRVQFPQGGGQNVNLHASFVLSRAAVGDRNLTWLPVNEETIVTEIKRVRTLEKRASTPSPRP